MQVKIDSSKLQQRLQSLHKVFNPVEGFDDIITSESASGAVSVVSQSEKKCFIRYVNEVMKKSDTKFVPIDAEETGTNDLIEKTADGVVFCYLINHAKPGTIKPAAINKGPNLSKFQMIENWATVMEAAKQIGCTAVSVSAEDCIAGKAFLPLIGLLWQVMRVDILSKVSLENSLKLISLKQANETVQQFMKLPQRTILVRWVNKQVAKTRKTLKKNGETEIQDQEVRNFEKDFSDGSVYVKLIHSVAPEKLTYEESLQLIQNEDKKAVAERIVEILKEMELKREFYISPEDIVAGTTTSARLNMTCIAAIFDTYGIESMEEVGIEETRELKRQILAFALDQFQNSTTAITSSQITDVVKAARNLLKDEDSADSITKELNAELERMRKLNDKLEAQLEEEKKRSELLLKEASINRAQLESQVESLQTKLDLSELKEAKRVEEEEERERVKAEEAKTKHQSSVNTSGSSSPVRQGYDSNVVRSSTRFGGFSFEEQLLLGAPTLWQPKSPEDITQRDIITTQETNIKELKQLLIYYRTRLKNTREDLNFAMSLAGEKGEIKLMQTRFQKDQSLEYLQKYESIGEKKIGMLYKEGRVRKSWKSRQFIVVNNYIFYYSKTTSEPQGFMRLDDCVVGIVDKNDEKKEYTFVVKTMSRELMLRASTMADMKAWMKAIAYNGRIDADLQDKIPITKTGGGKTPR
jgi:hypothetical protein